MITTKTKILLAVLCSALVTLIFAISDEDISIANELATWGVINDHKADPENYRFDAPVLRQEAMKMMLGLTGVKLSDTYVCKGYYTDAVFSPEHRDAWVCQSAELAADRGIITKNNKTTRPRDTISRVEALVMAWRATGMQIPTGVRDEREFFGTDGKEANDWQENLLQEALRLGVITANKEVTADGFVRYTWQHDKPATRGDVFRIIWTLQKMQEAVKQIPYLAVSGEVQYSKVSETLILSRDPSFVQVLRLGEPAEVAKKLSPKPIATRSQGKTLFLMQPRGEGWGRVIFSSITAIDGIIYQQYADYDPYADAMKAVLKKYSLSSEREFWDLEYGDTWEASRDFVDAFYLDKFNSTKIVYPEGSTVIP